MVHLQGCFESYFSLVLHVSDVSVNRMSFVILAAISWQLCITWNDMISLWED